MKDIEIPDELVILVHQIVKALVKEKGYFICPKESDVRLVLIALKILRKVHPAE